MGRDPDELDRALDAVHAKLRSVEDLIFGSPAAFAGVPVACPEDRALLRQVTHARALICPMCLREYRSAGSVWDLRPFLDALDEAEDAVHMGRGEPTWRRFLDKAIRVREFERRALPEFVGVKTFLELGGGLSYAAALVKLGSPDTVVVATDVSPRYLAQHAVPLADFLEAPVDVWVAATARRLPFVDGQFDRIWSAMLLYRLPDPVQAVAEIRRVLAPGGRWVGLEPAAPWAWPWAGREYARMARLNRERGTRETPRSTRFWRDLAMGEGLRFGVPPGSRVPWPWTRWALNAVRGVHVWLSMEREP